MTHSAAMGLCEFHNVNFRVYPTGHVGAIIGIAYRDLFNKFKVPMSIAGFEAPMSLSHYI